jgi:O-antigen ligase
VRELKQYNCRHINLEEIDSETVLGNTVIKIHRTDPNVAVRKGVYEQTISYIKQKPFLGYGWGSSAELLGRDESGTPLNTSRMFLEIALSVGLIGLGIFIAVFSIVAVSSAKVFNKSNSMIEKSVVVFAILGVVAIIVPNLFNAGLFLGFIWVFLGMVDVLRKM